MSSNLVTVYSPEGDKVEVSRLNSYTLINQCGYTMSNPRLADAGTEEVVVDDTETDVDTEEAVVEDEDEDSKIDAGTEEVVVEDEEVEVKTDHEFKSSYGSKKTRNKKYRST